MFRKISHTEGVKDDAEILFSTAFDYMFPDAARSRPCLLPDTVATHHGLRALGKLMADTGAPGSPQASLDSTTPAAFTYLGQFIDHDITARTDRDETVSILGRGEPVGRLDPDEVVAKLRNGRRPQLDLDSVFGEGPGLAGSAVPATTQSQILYDGAYRLQLFQSGSRVDLPRRVTVDLEGNTSYPAVIADARNDENLNVSQLHAAFLRFYNAVRDVQTGGDKARYVRARQLVRWAYQYVVVHDYLPAVCDPDIVADTLANGPRFIGSTAGRGDAFMPLEFSTAAFRFGHSMIRPFYRVNAASGDLTILQILGTSANAANFDSADHQLLDTRIIDWRNYVGSSAQRARKIDTKIAHDLFTLPFRPDDPILTNLAQSNLFRGYNLSIPTGQAICDAFGVTPMHPHTEILAGEDPGIVDVLKEAYFHHRTPLWYYILREAAVQQGGERLGEVGSRLVSETIIGLLKQDPNSFLNNHHDKAVKDNGIDVKPGAGGVINELSDILTFAGFTV
ncbi:MAG: heme peroxidase family protein [Vicinamibacterales bacterium]